MAVHAATLFICCVKTSGCDAVAAGENGGRADVRWGSIENKEGHGVTAVADANMLQMSVSQ